MTLKERICKDLKKAILAAGMKQTEVAKKMGSSPQTLNNALNIGRMSFEMIERICEAIDCDIEITIKKKNK